MSLSKFQELISKETEILEKLLSINELDLSVFTSEFPKIKKLRSSYVARRTFSTSAKSFFPKEFLEYMKIKSEIVKENILLVKYIMKKKQILRNGNNDDIYQEGCILLSEAVDMFDPDLGYKFSTYASSCIKMGLYRTIDKITNEVVIPRDICSGNRKIEKMKNSYYLKNGEFPSESYIKKYAKKMGIEYYQKLRMTSLICEDGEEFLHDPFEIVKTEDTIDIKKIIENFNILSENEKTRMEAFLECGSLAEVGRGLNLHRDAISQNFLSTVKKLKTKMRV